MLHSFFFFLSTDPTRISVTELVISPEMRQFASLTSSYQEYVKPCVSSISSSAYYNEGRYEGSCLLPDNWFSTETAFMIYSQFVQLDTNRDGLVKAEDIVEFNDGGLTMAFAQAVERVIGKGQGLNYERFLLFALSLYHLDTSAAKRVYFDILDGQNKGYLDKETVDVFTKEIAEKCSTKEKKFDHANITQLVFDSIQPRESTKIVVEDFIRMGRGGLVLNIMTDYHAFEELVQYYK